MDAPMYSPKQVAEMLGMPLKSFTPALDQDGYSGAEVWALREQHGLRGAAWAVVSSVRFILGVLAMACAFFSLLFALSHAPVSLVGPASASLTFVTNAIAAKFFLREEVDRRRWAAAVFVCLGVALMSR